VGSGSRPRRVADGVYVLRFRRVRVNVFVVLAKREVAVIDTGLPGSALRIAAAVVQLGRRVDEIKHVVVTHCHADHAGSAAALARMAPARVYMHGADAVLAREGHAHRPMWTVGAKGRILRPYIRAVLPGGIEPVAVDEEMEDGNELPIAGGLRVLHTPGHSAGHAALLAPDRGVVFAGDAAHNLLGLGLAPGQEDEGLARKSLRGLAEAAKGFDVVCVGHGHEVPPGALARRVSASAGLPAAR